MRHKSTTVTHHNGDVAGNRQNFGPVNNLGLELGPRDVQDVGYDGVHNKFGVRAKFGAGEGGDAIDEERGGTLHIANEELGQRRVNLEPVAAVPVAAGLGQLGGLVDDLGGFLVVPVEQHDAGGLHEAVDLLAAAELGEGEDLVVGLEGLVLGQGLGREPRHFEPRVEDLHVTGVLLGFLDLAHRIRTTTKCCLHDLVDVGLFRCGSLDGVDVVDLNLAGDKSTGCQDEAADECGSGDHG